MLGPTHSVHQAFRPASTPFPPPCPSANARNSLTWHVRTSEKTLQRPAPHSDAVARTSSTPRAPGCGTCRNNARRGVVSCASTILLRRRPAGNRGTRRAVPRRVGQSGTFSRRLSGFGRRELRPPRRCRPSWLKSASTTQTCRL